MSRKNSVIFYGKDSYFGDLLFVTFEERSYLFGFRDDWLTALSKENIAKIAEEKPVLGFCADAGMLTFPDQEVSQPPIETFIQLISESDYYRAKQAEARKNAVALCPTKKDKDAAKYEVLARIRALIEERRYADAFALASVYEIPRTEVECLIRKSVTGGIRF